MKIAIPEEGLVWLLSGKEIDIQGKDEHFVLCLDEMSQDTFFRAVCRGLGRRHLEEIRKPGGDPGVRGGMS
jgi:hypothetical protein